MIRDDLGICMIVAFVATYISLAVGSLLAWRAALNAAAMGPRRKIVRLFPLNALLFADELSPLGQIYKARCPKTFMIGLCCGTGMIAIMLALALTK